MNHRLILIKGPGAPRAVPLRNAVTTIGRQEDCQLRIASTEVSRKHCQLFEKNGYLLVKDLKSSNGTFVDGKRIKDQLILQPGQTLGVGPLAFRIDRISAEAEAAPAPAAAPAGNPADTAPGIPVATVIADEGNDHLDLDISVNAPTQAGIPTVKVSDDDMFGDLLDLEPAPAPKSKPAPTPPPPAPAAAPSPPLPAKSKAKVNPNLRPAPPKAEPEPPPPPKAKGKDAPEDVDEAVADFLFDIKIDKED